MPPCSGWAGAGTRPYNTAVLEDYVREALRQSRVTPSRSRGQHFLIDDAVLAQVISAAQLSGGEAVLEVGTGFGTLTRSLALRVWRVYTYELDSALVRYLRRYVIPETYNVVLEDYAFTEYELRRVIALAQEAGRSLKIVANLPYQISSAFLHAVANHAAELTLVVVMLQREVARRVMAQAGGKDYSSFSIYMQTFFSVRRVCDVPASAFFPAPKVDSAVIALTPLTPEQQPQMADRQLYFRLVEQVFRRRRKQLANALALAFPHLGAQGSHDALSAAGISPTTRPGSLSIADFVRLADIISQAGLGGGKG